MRATAAGKGVTGAAGRYSVRGNAEMVAKVNGNRLAVQVSLSRKRGREAEPDRPLPAGEGFTGGGGTPPFAPSAAVPAVPSCCRPLSLRFFLAPRCVPGVWHLAPES